MLWPYAAGLRAHDPARRVLLARGGAATRFGDKALAHRDLMWRHELFRWSRYSLWLLKGRPQHCIDEGFATISTLTFELATSGFELVTGIAEAEVAGCFPLPTNRGADLTRAETFLVVSAGND